MPCTCGFSSCLCFFFGVVGFYNLFVCVVCVFVHVTNPNHPPLRNCSAARCSECCRCGVAHCRRVVFAYDHWGGARSAHTSLSSAIARYRESCRVLCGALVCRGVLMCADYAVRRLSAVLLFVCVCEKLCTCAECFSARNTL